MKRTRRMRFGTWCRKDEEDTRKINYEFTDYTGKTTFFTSDDEVSFSMIGRIRNAWIKEISLVNNCFTRPEGEWRAVIYEDANN